MRKMSKVAPGWWDYTTLDKELLDEAARLSEKDVLKLQRPGFQVRFYDTPQEFYLAEALEYIEAWKQATPDSPAGICGPIGPTEQLPLVAQLVNALGMRLDHCHFWGMDEWVVDGKTVSRDFPLGFARAAYDLCFDRIRPELRMPDTQIHFPDVDTAPFIKSWNKARCVLMQGGQGEVKHWAFNDPPKREGDYADAPPPPEVYRKLTTRVVDLHPMTLMQNARTSGGGTVQNVPRHGRPRRDLACRDGLDLAPRPPRQPLRHAPDHPHDRQASAGCLRADVAAGRPSQCPVQLPAAGLRYLRRGDALV